MKKRLTNLLGVIAVGLLIISANASEGQLKQLDNQSMTAVVYESSGTNNTPPTDDDPNEPADKPRPLISPALNK